MSFELAREESLAENAARLARTRLDRILGALASLGDAPPSAQAVHESRRDLKKLRALLRLARASLGPATCHRANTAYRDAGRLLSAVRDAGVLLHTFDKLRGELAGHVPQVALDAMQRGLTAARQAAEHTLAPHARLPEVAASLAAARARIDHWPQPGKTNESWHTPGRGLAATYRRGRRAMRRAAEARAEDNFHEWRKQVKHLAYQCQILGPLFGEKFKQKRRHLASLGDLLGNEHDLAVLALTLTRNHPDLLPAVAAITRHVHARRRELQHAALKLGRRIYRRRPRRFERQLKECWQRWRSTSP